MKGTLFENGVQKGIISDFNVTPAKNIYQDVMGEKVVVGKSNATATFTSPIGMFDHKKSYEVHSGDKVYKIKVTKQTNTGCLAIIENHSKDDDETSLP